ncbi:hypothetical protein ABZ883_10890 [Streptomyces sp. NPDC046977]|uniref:hypothetical protein n=1 Tax=Streptomyces sp. NPDC046977 TaxID=3154703 RepID=UPI0033E6B28B
MRAVRGWALGLLVAAEAVLAACLLAGVPVPPPVLRGTELCTVAVAAWRLPRLVRAHRQARRRGLSRPAALRAAVRDAVPVPVRRLARHELALAAGLLRWITRRPRHGVGKGDTAVPYSGAQAATMYGFLFVSVVETVLLALIIPWPAVHAVTLVLDLWGCFFVLALHAACVVRPHVVGADGSLRVRYGALVDIRVPADRIATARVDRRFPDGRLLTLAGDGTADLVVGGQTTVTVELTEPVAFLRPLGAPARARVLRFHADDPRAAVAALGWAGRGASGNVTSPAVDGPRR